MPNGNGKTTVKTAVENALALAVEMENSVLTILSANERAIAADMADDKPYMQGYNLLQTALDIAVHEGNHELESILRRSRTSIGSAIGLDLGDTTKEALSSYLLSYQDRAQALQARLREISHTLGS